MNTLTRYFFLFIISLSSSSALASNTVSMTNQYDLSNPISIDTPIWENEQVGKGIYFGGGYLWLCYSSTDPKNGACPTKRIDSNAHGKTSINLQFVEKRSGMKQDIQLTGYKNQLSSGGCASLGPYPLAELPNNDCGIYEYDYLSLYVSIGSAEFAKFPVGGIWEATLKLKYTDANDMSDQPYTAYITMNVADKNHAEIYLPAYGEAAPLIELDLHPRGAPNGNAYAQDTTTLDMCLYDGYNANSTHYDVTLMDEGKSAPGRSSNDFSIYRVGDTSGAETERIDYHVQMKNPATGGGILNVNNNQQFTLQNINQSLVRPVHLPHMRVPVLCVPTPLIFTVDKFDIKDKSAGFYKGILTVLFTPSTIWVE